MSTDTATETRTEGPALPVVLTLSHLRWMETDSTNIARLAYNAAQETLAVEHHSNREGISTFYIYSGVSAQRFAELTSDKSLGRYYNANIANGRYPFERYDITRRTTGRPQSEAVLA